MPRLRRGAQSVKEILEQVAAEVGRLPDSTMAEMIPVLQAAQREVERDLAVWLSQGQEAADTFTAKQYREVLLQLKLAQSRKPGKWVHKVEEDMRDRLSEGGRRAAKLSITHLAFEVAELSRQFGKPIAIPLNTAALLVKGDKMLLPRFAKQSRRYAKWMQDDIRLQLAVGVTRNETFDQLTTRLMKLSKQKPTKLKRPLIERPGEIANGLFGRARYRAERIVRTEMINAYNVQQNESLKVAASKNEGMQKRWDASLDMRVCLVCRGLHGKVVDVGKEFPGGYQHPPAHPNCRCAEIAWHADWAKDTKK